jgi:hypothetical protein
MLLTLPMSTTVTVWLHGTEFAGNTLLVSEKYGAVELELAGGVAAGHRAGDAGRAADGEQGLNVGSRRRYDVTPPLSDPRCPVNDDDAITWRMVGQCAVGLLLTAVEMSVVFFFCWVCGCPPWGP